MVESKTGSRAHVRRQLQAVRGGHRRGPTARIGVILAVAAALIAALVLGVAHTLPDRPSGGSPEGVPAPVAPPLASADTTAGGRSVAGVGCDSAERVSYHIHVHLAVFVDGRPMQIPAGIGVAAPRQVQQTPSGAFVDDGSCFYWLHTHAADGIIHVESPTKASYTLGQFFAIWGQPLSATGVGPAHGAVTVLVDGHLAATDPRAITLTAHRAIQLDVGTPAVPAQPVSFPQGL